MHCTASTPTAFKRSKPPAVMAHESPALDFERLLTIQVHPGGLRHIRSDRRINEWRAPGRKTITRATTNERQVVIAMTGGELVYFELAAAGTLLETEKKEVGGDIASLDVAPVPTGRQRSRFLAVGGFDSTVISQLSIYCTVGNLLERHDLGSQRRQ